MVQAAEIAISQANRILDAGGTGINFTSNGLIVDSKLDPVAADQGFRTLVDQWGAQVVVGPAASLEILGLKNSSDLREVPVISPSSTSPVLKQIDYIFRLTAPDDLLARALALRLYTLGMRHVATITGSDSLLVGFRDSFKTTFLSFSGTEVADTRPTTYDNFDLTSTHLAVDTLNDQVGTLIANAGGDPTKVGVVDVGYGSDQFYIYDYARTKTNLPNIRWSEGYGADQAYLLPASQGGNGSQDTAAFQLKVNLTGALYTLPPPGPGQVNMDSLFRYGAVISLVGGGSVDLRGTGFVNVTGREPAFYGSYLIVNYAYDAAWVAMLSILKANSYVGRDIAAQIGNVANSTVGATGVLTLSAFGDRAAQDYVYWSFKKTDSSIAGCSTPPCYFIDLTTGPFYESDTNTIVSSLPPASETPGATQAQTFGTAATIIQTYAFGTLSFTIETNARILNVTFSSDPHLRVLLYARYKTLLNATLPQGYDPTDVKVNGTTVSFRSTSNTDHSSVSFSFNPSTPGKYIAEITMSIALAVPPPLPLVALLVLSPIMRRFRRRL